MLDILNKIRNVAAKKNTLNKIVKEIGAGVVSNQLHENKNPKIVAVLKNNKIKIHAHHFL